MYISARAGDKADLKMAEAAFLEEIVTAIMLVLVLTTLPMKTPKIVLATARRTSGAISPRKKKILKKSRIKFSVIYLVY